MGKRPLSRDLKPKRCTRAHCLARRGRRRCSQDHCPKARRRKALMPADWTSPGGSNPVLRSTKKTSTSGCATRSVRGQQRPYSGMARHREQPGYLYRARLNSSLRSMGVLLEFGRARNLRVEAPGSASLGREGPGTVTHHPSLLAARIARITQIEARHRPAAPRSTLRAEYACQAASR